MSVRSAVSLLAVFAVLSAGGGTDTCRGAIVKAGPPDAAAAADSIATPADPDTSGVDRVLSPFLIQADRIGREVRPGEVRAGGYAIDLRDHRTADEAAPLLPSTRVTVNSRGEALFMVRAAPERHVRLFEDRIPLAVPWDERADLSLVPTEAIGEVRATRGVHSVLDGPNALAGVIRLVPFEPERAGARTRLAFTAGEGERFQAHLLHAVRQGDWNGLFAASRRERAAFLLPRSVDAPFHQGAGRARTNSDAEQSSVMARVGRKFDGGGAVRLTLHGMDGAKGVPPETHREDARFWRYPEVRRALAGLSVETPIRRGGAWFLRADGSLDWFRQEIRKFDDATYSTPELAAGVDHEKNDDRTGYGSLRLTGPAGPFGSVSLQSVFRKTIHVETIQVDGPESRFSQSLGSVVGEGTVQLLRALEVRGGAGYEIASTPETGGMPRRDATGAEVLHIRVSGDAGGKDGWYGTASRRSRFPSLRELYSGALGRFVPNPDLEPERQDLVEAGVFHESGRLSICVALFAADLDGAIEKTVLPGGEGKFQRRNVGRIRTLGFETAVSYRPRPGMAFAADHTILDSRREEEGGDRAPAEDRPAYQSSISATFLHLSGAGLGIEGIVTGPRHGADTTDEADGLRRLPAQGSVNARVSWAWTPVGRSLSDVEFFLRVNNLSDSRIDSQVGLPDAGRTALAGFRVGFGV